jgi:hypothetical protein
MIQGDPQWRTLARRITVEDARPVAAHNAQTLPEYELHHRLGPVPFAGAIATAPVVLLLSHVELDTRATPADYSRGRAGWPLSALHPKAPIAPADWWRARAGELIDEFGAQHVSNALAAVYLTPWHTACFDARLRLPSRPRMLRLAESAAGRDATLILMRGADLWTESTAIASLPLARCIRARSWRATELTRANLGDQGWDQVRRCVEVHAWLG